MRVMFCYNKHLRAFSLPEMLVVLVIIGILSDAVGYMAGQLTMEKYPEKIRRVIYWDKENKRKFIFFTNARTISPVMVAKLYHNRWQIELFFKWIKQHLKIKKFWGTSENAVRI